MVAKRKGGGAFTQAVVESEAGLDFVRAMDAGNRVRLCQPPRRSRSPVRLELDEESVKKGLGRLVLTLVKLLHELLERQAIRRMVAGSLSEEQIEKLGMAMMNQADEIEGLRKMLGLEEEDLNMDLGPLGKVM